MKTAVLKGYRRLWSFRISIKFGGICGFVLLANGSALVLTIITLLTNLAVLAFKILPGRITKRDRFLGDSIAVLRLPTTRCLLSMYDQFQGL